MEEHNPNQKPKAKKDKIAKGENTLAIYLEEIARYPRISRDRERELALRIQQGDDAALRELITANLKFVVNHAKRFQGLGLSMTDLINEGNIGLIQAAKRFDPDRNVKFITYAVWWIRQAIMQALANAASIVRLPLKQATVNVQYNKKFRELSNLLNRHPTMQEMAQALGLKERELENILRVARTTVSLEPALDDEEPMYVPSVISPQLSPEQMMEQTSLILSIDELMESLTEREKEVIRLHYGLGGAKRLTLDQIGKKYKLTRERIRQIEAKAKEKLKRLAVRKQLNDYLN